MWKLLIADDEPKIRKGLRNSLDWAEIGVEIVGEAEDGEIALDIVRNNHPDIILLDICMPFINGLQLIEKVKQEYDECIMIVVTGHDEFSYAREALRLGVFDYVLKPVSKEQLHNVIIKAIDEISSIKNRNKYYKWAQNQLSQNYKILKEKFMNEWLENHFSSAEIREQLDYYKVKFTDKTGMLLVKPVDKNSMVEVNDWDNNLLLFAIQNVIEELVENMQPNMVFRDNKDNIVALTGIPNISEWLQLKDRFESCMEKYLDKSIRVYQKIIEKGMDEIPSVYDALIDEMSKESSYTPMVIKAKQYIENNFFKEELSLEDVARDIKVSSSYLSRVLKQETGTSFIDYLTQVRVKMAIQLMNDPSMKIYEIAERVGYNSQHYFSTAFKKVLGVSPVEYKKGGR
ncbi:MAG: response regulator [Eubacterium sp.]|jgi:two-component system response regulator YesN|nr:response regulator [Eubacterium sp.]